VTIYGLTEDGFVPKTTEEVRASLNTRIRGRLGASMDLSDEDPVGFVVGLVAAEIGETWELGEAVNSASSRDSATGAALEAIGLLTGSFKAEAEPSTTVLTLTGTPTTTVPALSQARTDSTEAVFETLADAEIGAAAVWVPAAAYVVGDRIANASRIYRCITAGTSAGAGGPTSTAEDITDNTAHWRYLGEGTGYVDVDAQCTEDGATVALSGDINVIVTNVSGWSSVINVASVAVGREEASDEEYRLAQEIDLASPGTGTVDAIREALLELEGVTAVKLFVNNTDVTDGDGVPPHAIEPLVEDGEDQDIWDALLANVAAGIATHGTEDGTATDSEGNAHAMSFSRPTGVPAYVEIDVYFPTGETPDDAATQIKTAIATRGDALGIGRNGNIATVIAAAMSVDGVYDVANVLCDDVDPPVATSFAVSSRQRSTWDTANIVVNLFEGTP
jgi:hypothetical protein